jgi:cytochrome c oxidase subunit I
MIASISVPQDKLARQIFLLWFILSITALAASGIYSVLPFALRTPFIAHFLNLKDIFKTSLVVHVNLAVLVWFLSFFAMLMTLIIKESFLPVALTAFISSMMGGIFIIVSPFLGSAEAIINNYVPILHNFTFIIGIALFLTGIFLQVLLVIPSYKLISNNIIHHSIYISAIIFLISGACFIKSAIELNILSKNRFIDLLEYYELLFWGAGHVLQFNYVQLVIIVWLWISQSTFLLSKTFLSIQWLNLLMITPCLIIYWIYQFDSHQLYNFFTLHMKYLGGVLLSITALAISLETRFINIIHRTCFLSSLFLIAIGGIIGYLIIGSNVTIPAHYHGVIIGITVAIMGMFYNLLPQMGFKEVSYKKASLQMIIYTIGQFIHVLALAISGGYGALRKTPGIELSTKAKFFMSMMGVGGIIALTGGIMFVTLIFGHIKKNDYKKAN